MHWYFNKTSIHYLSKLYFKLPKNQKSNCIVLQLFYTPFTLLQFLFLIIYMSTSSLFTSGSISVSLASPPTQIVFCMTSYCIYTQKNKKSIQLPYLYISLFEGFDLLSFLLYHKIYVIVNYSPQLCYCKTVELILIQWSYYLHSTSSFSLSLNRYSACKMIFSFDMCQRIHSIWFFHNSRKTW